MIQNSKSYGNLSFYQNTIKTLQNFGYFDKNEQILVVNGGGTDAKVLKELNFVNVTIANLDERIQGTSPFAPYLWSFQKTEDLTFDDNTFDYVLVHSGLHHMRCPQQGILEMFRVAKKGILGFEPHDCLYTRLGVKSGFGQKYETAAVFYNNLKFGGVDNTHIPNFVYRFAARDIVKTIQVNNPIGEHKFRFFYETRMPGHLKKLKNPFLRYSAIGLEKIFELLGSYYPFLANNIAFYVEKEPKSLFPWLEKKEEEIVLNQKYFYSTYFDNSQ